jgi:hypothetical protein
MNPNNKPKRGRPPRIESLDNDEMDQLTNEPAKQGMLRFTFLASFLTDLQTETSKAQSASASSQALPSRNSGKQKQARTPENSDEGEQETPEEEQETPEESEYSPFDNDDDIKELFNQPTALAERFKHEVSHRHSILLLPFSHY